MRHMIFGLVELAMTVYDPKATGFVILTLMVLSMSLPAFYFSYRAGYVKGEKEGKKVLLDKMSEVLDLIKEANETTFGINVAFRNIDALEIIQKEERG